MPDPIRLALVWHMHQPSYRDTETGAFLLPWTRLHATKDYRDMPALLRRYPRVHATFNLTPILLEQLDAIARGASDRCLDLARRPAAELTEGERRLIATRFFDVNEPRMLQPPEPYRELLRRAGEATSARGPGGVEAPARGEPLSVPELRELQVWFHLAWADPSYWDE